MNRSWQLSGYRGLALALVLLCAQGLQLAHSANHEHTGANVPVCLICAAAEVSFIPVSAPALPVAVTPRKVRTSPASLLAAASNPDTTCLPRAPPSRA